MKTSQEIYKSQGAQKVPRHPGLSPMLYEPNNFWGRADSSTVWLPASHTGDSSNEGSIQKLSCMLGVSFIDTAAQVTYK